MTPLHETLEELLTTHQAPVYVVHFTQAAALERAQALTSINVCTREEKDRIAELIGGFRFSPGFGKTLSRLVKHGIGVHHAGMLPKYRRLVEQLAQAGLLKVICGTDTLGVGINVPIRTVVFTGLSKYDGRRQRLLKAREFHQIAGRAGRAGYDTAGTVVVQAPDHVVENHRLVTKAGDDPKKLRKVQRKKPPEGQVNWTEETFERLVAAEPEALVSRMRVSHAMLLNVIARAGQPVGGDAAPAARQPRGRPRARCGWCGGPPPSTARCSPPAWCEQVDPPERGRPPGAGWSRACSSASRSTSRCRRTRSPSSTPSTRRRRRTRSTWSRSSRRPSRTRGRCSVAQEHKARGEAIGEMKADGIEYDERMELLDEVTWPKPLEELLEHTYELYRAAHPWVAEDALSPKSVVRDMYERAMTFAEYVAFYGLTRIARGWCCATSATPTARCARPCRTACAPTSSRTSWSGSGAVVRQTDSSLLDEWEQLTDPDRLRGGAGTRRAAARAGADHRQRARVHRAGAQRDVPARRAGGADRVDAARRARGGDGSTMTGEEWRDALEAYFAEHDAIDTGPDARGPQMLLVEKGARTWEVQQILGDPEGDHDWRITADGRPCGLRRGGRAGARRDRPRPALAAEPLQASRAGWRICRQLVGTRHRHLPTGPARRQESGQLGELVG